MEEGEKKYPDFFTLHTVSLLGKEKEKGKEMMKQSWNHMKKGLLFVLERTRIFARMCLTVCLQQKNW